MAGRHVAFDLLLNDDLNSTFLDGNTGRTFKHDVIAIAAQLRRFYHAYQVGNIIADLLDKIIIRNGAAIRNSF